MNKEEAIKTFETINEQDDATIKVMRDEAVKTMKDLIKVVDHLQIGNTEKLYVKWLMMHTYCRGYQAGESDYEFMVRLQGFKRPWERKSKW